MKLGLQEPDWKYIGSVLASADSNSQAAFFKAFVKECKSWGTHFQIETQLMMVNAELSAEEKSILSTIGFSDELPKQTPL